MSVIVVRPSEYELQPVGEASPIKLRVVSDGLDGEPYVHVTECPPQHHIDTHSHSETEITIVLSGSATVGGKTCGAGSVLVIPANEEYSLDAGDEPLVFAVVRPRKASYTFTE